MVSQTTLFHPNGRMIIVDVDSPMHERVKAEGWTEKDPAIEREKALVIEREKAAEVAAKLASYEAKDKRSSKP